MGHCAWLEPLTKTGKRKRNGKENGKGRNREMDGRKSFVSTLSPSPLFRSPLIPGGRLGPADDGADLQFPANEAGTIHAGTSPSS